MFSKCASAKRPTFWAVVALMVLSSVSVIAAQSPGAPTTPRIHAVSDIGHEFTFYADGRFHTQYLPGQPRSMCWGALYNYDFSNANLLILLGCENRLAYLPKDIKTIKTFLTDGGGVVILSSAGATQQNKLTEVFGCTFKSRAKKPFYGNLPEMEGDIEGHADWIQLKDPTQWQVLIKDADSKPILVRNKTGKGCLLIGARGLAGSNPNAKDNINAVWWKPLLVQMAANKKINPKKSFGRLGFGQLEYTENLGSIKLHYHEYLKPYATAMADIYQRTKPVMRRRMGVPLSEGMAGAIGLLATGGGGFSSGRMLGLAVFWGGFPEREDGMIEFITHETVHSWVLPFAEIWNEPIATYVGDLVMADMGHEEEGMKRIQSNIARASKIDPTMKLYDLSGKSLKDIPPLTGGQANHMHWGKTFWIFEQLRKENPDVLADYFRAKRKLAIPGKLKKYDTNATVAVMSVAMGRDMFPWFREHGFDVSKEDSPIKLNL
jgi:hypothetical protein